MKCLEKDPKQRFRNTINLLNALSSAYGEAVEETPITQPQVEIPHKEPLVVQPSKPVSQEQTLTPKPVTKWIPWVAGLLILVLVGIIIIQAIQPPERIVVDVPTNQSTQISVTTRIFTTTIVVPTDTQISPSAVPILDIGSTQISEVDSMVMVFIPAGDYLMGSTDIIINRLIIICEEEQFYSSACPILSWESEKPKHQIFLDSYWIDQTEITNQMYTDFLNSISFKGGTNSNWFDENSTYTKIHAKSGLWEPVDGYKNHPMIEVTWYGAQSYCDWAGRRLPTEAEWEKAGRGSGGNTYPWGDKIGCLYSNYWSDDGRCIGDTTEVGAYEFGKSSFGVYDMAGNGWEWVEDWFSIDYYSISPQNNPFGPLTGSEKVLRGGSFNALDYQLRVTSRYNMNPESTKFDIGFRCAGDAIQ